MESAGARIDMSIWRVNSEAALRQAITNSAAGDTIAVQAGDYHISMAPGGRYDIKITKSLNIVGEGGRANFYSDGHQVEKGIFNLRLEANETVSFDNIGFLNAHNGAMNGAGIRQNGGNLNVNNSYFENSNNGILSTTSDEALRGDVRVTNSEFNGAGEFGYSHAMYVLANNLIVEGNYIHDLTRGHHVKSLAGSTIVRNNILDDGDGTSSYAVDIGAGGDALIEGNTIIQGVNGESAGIISFASDRVGSIPGSMIIRNNLIQDHQTQSHAALLVNRTDVEVQVLNNVIEGLKEDALFSGLFNQTGNTLDGIGLVSYSTGYNATRGTSGADVMYALREKALPLNGGSGNDTILGNIQSDLLLGGNGHDLISGGRGNDNIYGQSGNDILLGDIGNDSIYGQGGNDIIFDATGSNLLWGGAGKDLIFGFGKSAVNGNAGNDFLINYGPGQNNSRMNGGDGNDILFGREGEDILHGGTGRDIAVYSGTYATYAVTESFGNLYIENIVAALNVSDTGGRQESIAAIESLQFSDGYLDLTTSIFHANQFLFDYGAFMNVINDLDNIAATPPVDPVNMVPLLQAAYTALYDLL
jgi:Ca2+-binding RTX toxin-like protein